MINSIYKPTGIDERLGGASTQTSLYERISSYARQAKEHLTAAIRPAMYGLAILVASASSLPGCSQKDVLRQSPPAEYSQIDGRHLTAEQKELLNEFNARKLTQKDLEFISQFPWMDSNNLSDQDKIFLMGAVKGAYAGSTAVHRQTQGNR